MSNYRVLTYDITSKSSKLLAEALGNPLRIKPHNSTYRYRPEDRIVNFGLYGDRSYPIVANQFSGVANSTSKMRSFQRFKEHGVKHPRYTRELHTAESWLEDGYKVYARSCDSGDHGKGITVVHPNRGESLPSAEFYTRGIDNDREYRVYCAFGEVFGIREKLNPGGLNEEIRASDEWTYRMVSETAVPRELVSQCIKACKAVGLDFVGADACIDTAGKVWVFEVNSAPWLSPVLAEKLANIIMRNT